MQASLFDFGIPAFDPDLGGIQRMDLGAGAWVDYLPHWLGGHEVVYRDLADGADWKQGRRLMYDRTVAVPRLTAAAPEAGPGAGLLHGHVCRPGGSLRGGLRRHHPRLVPGRQGQRGPPRRQNRTPLR